MEIKLLDDILRYLIYIQKSEKPYIVNAKDIDLQFQDVNKQFFSSAIKKLVDDGYIYLEENVNLNYIKPTVIAGFCDITIDGILFIKIGGYENYYNKLQIEENLMSDLKSEQRRHSNSLVRLNRWLVILTLVIAVGTLVAALYYSIEILSFFCAFDK